MHWLFNQEYAQQKQRQNEHANSFVLHPKIPQQRPLSNHTFQCFTIPDHRQCQATSVQLGQIPPLFCALEIHDAPFAINAYCSAPGVTKRNPDVLPIFTMIQSTPWIRHSPDWISKHRFRLQLHGHK